MNQMNVVSAAGEALGALRRAFRSLKQEGRWFTPGGRRHRACRSLCGCLLIGMDRSCSLVLRLGGSEKKRRR